MTHPFEGIIPPVITPFGEDGAVDESGFATLIDYMLNSDVHAIIVGGTTGEFYALSREERVRQFHLARDVIGSRAPLICGVNDISTEGVCAYAEAARSAGADGLLVAAPYYSVPTQRELADHCLTIDRATGLPIMLYNYPGRTGATMGREFFQQVGESANVRAIKEASGDIDQVHMLAREFPQIALSCGADDQALEFFAWGATSWVTPMGNFFAEEVVAFYETCRQLQDHRRARDLMCALLPLTRILETGGQLVQCVKFGTQFCGLPGGPVRSPLGPIDDVLAGEMRETLTTARESFAEILAQTKTDDLAETAPVRTAGGRLAAAPV